MRKFLPTLLVLIIGFAYVLLLFRNDVITKKDYHYLLISSLLFCVLNYVFIPLLQKANGIKSISAIMGVSGVSMIVFVLTLVLYQPILKTKIILPIALALFVHYVLYKLALFIPVLRK